MLNAIRFTVGACICLMAVLLYPAVLIEDATRKRKE